MLSLLHIENIALIESAEIAFGPGFNALTGETGAGKSIVIDSIGAVMGERTSRDLIRTGAKAALVSAVFQDLPDLPWFQEMGIFPDENGELTISRQIQGEGKNLCRVGGRPCTVVQLKALGGQLLNIHGQHDGQQLLDESCHLRYLDSFGGLEGEAAVYRAAFEALTALRREKAALVMDEGEKARLSDLLHYQIDEIEAANVRVGEREELEAQRELIRNSEKIASALELLRGLLSGDEESEGLLAGISQAAAQAGRVAAYLPELAEASQKLQEAGYLLEDVDAILHGTAVDFDPALQESIEERLDLLYKLGLKYGGSEEKILEYLEDCRIRLHQIEFSDEERERLEAQYETQKTAAIALAKELSEQRKAASKQFISQVKGELAFLNMPGIAFETEIQRVPLYHMGCDKLQFLVSANKGEPPKPMSKIASGGELSRIMLAIKTVLSGKDKVDTLIFDEVDTGISGAAANKVGQKLKQVSQNRQVLCITHLAQIAALADHHFLISKHVEGERTYTQVQGLDFEGRKREVARIIGGDQVTDLQLEMAGEMLKKG